MSGQARTITRPHVRVDNSIESMKCMREQLIEACQRHNIRVVNEYGFAVPNPRRHE